MMEHDLQHTAMSHEYTDHLCLKQVYDIGRLTALERKIGGGLYLTPQLCPY